MAESRRRQGEEREGDDEARASSSTEVLLLVCIECGREYQYEDGDEIPTDLECEKCGNTVFRPFEDAAEPNDIQADFRETTERDLVTSDPEGDATVGDLHDLNSP